MGQQMKRTRLPIEVMPDIVRVYNLHFENTRQLQVTYKLNRFPAICRIFNKKWCPQENRKTFLTTFSLEGWSALPQKKESHTLKKCQACIEKFTALSSAFPTATTVSWSTYIKLRKAEGLAISRKQPAENGANGEPSSKRRYGNLFTTLQIDTQKILTEAQVWSTDKNK